MKTTRGSNYELMRIISMFMIVCWHVFLNGANIGSGGENIMTIYYLLRAIMVVHVNSFVLVSGYFQCKSKFKMSKLLSLNNSVWFYKVVILIGAIILGERVTKITIIRNVFPLDLENYWFIKIYLMLYILSPYLNRLIENIGKKEHKRLVLILFFMFSLISTCTGQEALYGTVNSGYSLASFMFLYLLGAYFRKYPIKNTYFGKRFSLSLQKLILFCGFFIIALINFSFNIVSLRLLNGGSVSKYIGNIINIAFVQYDNPLVVIQSVMYFLFFGYLSFNSKIINKISATTFGVYLIHENLFLRYNMYKVLKFPAVVTSKTIFIRVFIVSLIIFIICSVIEYIRQIIFGKIYNMKISCKFRKKYRLYLENLGFKINW